MAPGGGGTNASRESLISIFPSADSASFSLLGRSPGQGSTGRSEKTRTQLPPFCLAGFSGIRTPARCACVAPTKPTNNPS